MQKWSLSCISTSIPLPNLPKADKKSGLSVFKILCGHILGAAIGLNISLKIEFPLITLNPTEYFKLVLLCQGEVML